MYLCIKKRPVSSYRPLPLWQPSQSLGKVKTVGSIAVGEIEFVRTTTVHTRIQTQVFATIITAKTLQFLQHDAANIAAMGVVEQLDLLEC